MLSRISQATTFPKQSLDSAQYDHVRDVGRGVFGRSPVFAACSNRLLLSALYRHFPPAIAGVATWVAIFLARALVSCRHCSSGQTFLLFTLFYPFLQSVGRNANGLANTNRWQLSSCNHPVHFCVSKADACEHLHARPTDQGDLVRIGLRSNCYG